MIIQTFVEWDDWLTGFWQFGQVSTVPAAGTQYQPCSALGHFLVLLLIQLVVLLLKRLFIYSKVSHLDLLFTLHLENVVFGDEIGSCNKTFSCKVVGENYIFIMTHHWSLHLLNMQVWQNQYLDLLSHHSLNLNEFFISIIPVTHALQVGTKKKYLISETTPSIEWHSLVSTKVSKDLTCKSFIFASLYFQYFQSMSGDDWTDKYILLWFCSNLPGACGEDCK